MSDQEKTVVVETAKNPVIANLIIQALKFEGIPAYVDGCQLQDGFAISQRVLGRNCVEIQVPESCVDEAHEIIATMKEAGKALAEEDGGDDESPKGILFTRRSDEGYREPVEGLLMRTLVHGEKTLMIEARLSKGAPLPLHRHPHEQTGYLVSGKLRFNVEGETFDAEPGDSWCIPANMEHNAEVLEDSVAVEVFAPVREDYLP